MTSTAFLASSSSTENERYLFHDEDADDDDDDAAAAAAAAYDDDHDEDDINRRAESAACENKQRNTDGRAQPGAAPAALIAWNVVVGVPASARVLVEIIAGIHLARDRRQPFLVQLAACGAWFANLCVHRAHHLLCHCDRGTFRAEVARVTAARGRWRRGLGGNSD